MVHFLNEFSFLAEKRLPFPVAKLIRALPQKLKEITAVKYVSGHKKSPVFGRPFGNATNEFSVANVRTFFECAKYLKKKKARFFRSGRKL
jgi:hypothetical protein